MKHPASVYLTFRLDPADDEGTEVLTFIVGGDHRGGVAEGRLSWTGGKSPALAEVMAARVDRWLDEAVREQQVLLWDRERSDSLAPGW